MSVSPNSTRRVTRKGILINPATAFEGGAERLLASRAPLQTLRVVAFYCCTTGGRAPAEPGIPAKSARQEPRPPDARPCETASKQSADKERRSALPSLRREGARELPLFPRDQARHATLARPPIRTNRTRARRGYSAQQANPLRWPRSVRETT